MLILLEERQIVVGQGIAAKPVRRESVERVAMPATRAFDAPQSAHLILLVRDAEPRLEQHVGAKLPEQLGAERVDGAALDLRSGRAELRLETVGDLAGSLVRE